jgi:arylformamidase
MLTENRQNSKFVYRDYTQSELDKAYTQAEWATNFREVLARQASESAQVRSRLAPQTVRYGSSVQETLDIFAPSKICNAPIHVHVHGGAWKALTKEDVSFPAPFFVDRNIVYIALNFDVIPAVKIPGMVQQISRAICWIYENASVFGGDRDKIHISGHSAGAHLSSVLLTLDWQQRFNLPPNVLKSGVLVSGTYDLDPVMKSARSSYISLTRDEIHSLSAINHIQSISSPIVLAVGELESPEFRRQALDFYNLLREANVAVSLIDIPRKNHFEVMDEFVAEHSELGRATIELIRALKR